MMIPVEFEPSTARRIKAWAVSSWEPPIPETRDNSVERAAQNEPATRISLVDFSVNLNAARNNLSEVERSNRLAGVSEPGTAGSKSHSIDFSTTGEVVRGGQFADEYFRAHVEYSVLSTGHTATATNTGVTPPIVTTVPTLPTVSRSKNRVIIESGFFYHPFELPFRGLPLYNPHKFDPKLGFVIEPFRFDTPLAREELAVDAHFDANGNVDRPSFKLALDRSGNSCRERDSVMRTATATLSSDTRAAGRPMR